MNTEGSYRCDCADKYRRNNAGTACEGEQFGDSNKSDGDDNEKAAVLII